MGDGVLADLILLAHFLFVLFVVGGFAMILTGIALNWRWVRNFRFRVLHLAAIVFVMFESLAGMMCPLTVWEDALRGSGMASGFIQRWVQRLLFYDWPGWVFTSIYVVFAMLVGIVFWLAPPARRN